MGPPVSDVTFFDQEGQLGPPIDDIFFIKGGQLGPLVIDDMFFLSKEVSLAPPL